MVAEGHFQRKRGAPLTVEGCRRTLSGPSPDWTRAGHSIFRSLQPSDASPKGVSDAVAGWVSTQVEWIVRALLPPEIMMARRWLGG
jgi:hypothetical protein